MDLYFPLQIKLDAGEEPYRKIVGNRLDMQFPKKPVQGVYPGQTVTLYDQPAQKQAVQVMGEGKPFRAARISKPFCICLFQFVNLKDLKGKTDPKYKFLFG